MRGRVFIALFAVILGAVACTRPSSVEEFRKYSQRDSLGRYCFVMDFSDSTAMFDVSFFTRIDCRPAVFRSMGDIPVEVLWTSPSGLNYGETVYIPRDSHSRSTAFSKEYLSPYRKGLVPDEHGKWTLALTVPLERRSGLRGMGVACTASRTL